jgi:hypothetical protein
MRLVARGPAVQLNIFPEDHRAMATQMQAICSNRRAMVSTRKKSRRNEKWQPHWALFIKYNGQNF